MRKRGAGTAAVVPQLRDPARRRLLITGDVLVHAVQLIDPELAYANDMDPGQARASRRAVLDDVRARGSTMAVSHLGTDFREL